MARLLAALLLLTAVGCDDSIDRDGDDYPVSTDCDDDDPDVHPFAAEIADDGVDQDCSGGDLVSCWFDGDGDGFGTGDAPLGGQDPSGVCELPGLVDQGGDCDDGAPATFPGAPELPDDGFDQDCSGADTVTCYVDADGDGFGDPGVTALAEGSCLGDGQSSSDGDCDDGDAQVHPDADEIAEDGVDQDCSGSDAVLCFYDGDGDGYGAPGTDLPDPDGDCGDNQSADGTDCDDAAPSLNPGATELCDFIDNDCDGVVDRGTGALSLGSGGSVALGSWDLSSAPWTIELSVRRDVLGGEAAVLSADDGGLTIASAPAWTLLVMAAGALGTEPVAGAWSHLAVVSDGATIRLVVDGVETLLSGNPAGPLLDGPWVLGAVAGGLVGAIDELRLWGVARSPEALAAGACTTLVGDEEALVAWWPFADDADEALSGAPGILADGAVVSP